MATAIVSLTSPLIRKKWLKEGLVQKASTSFWAPYTGLSSDSIVHQSNNSNAGDGHTVTFDYDGNLASKAIKGKDQAFGTGEQKRKFSNSLTVERYRLTVDNGDDFDGVNIGDLSITQHAKSRSGLGDLFIRWKDQALFDTAQGFKDSTVSETNTPHRIFYDASSTKISYNTLAGIEKTLKTGSLYHVTANPLGYATGTLPSTAVAAAGKTRAPLKPFRTADGKSIWLLVVDADTAWNIKANTVANSGIIALGQHADIRGMNNIVFSGVIGQIGALVIVEASNFFGDTSNTGLNGTATEIAGLRGWDLTNTSWTGQSGYATTEYSRNLILGANALQIGFGKMPDYKFKTSPDFDIKSESAMEFWANSQKVNLTAENDDYNQAKIAGMDYACIPFDVKH